MLFLTPNQQRQSTESVTFCMCMGHDNSYPGIEGQRQRSKCNWWDLERGRAFPIKRILWAINYVPTAESITSDITTAFMDSECQQEITCTTYLNISQLVAPSLMLIQIMNCQSLDNWITDKKCNNIVIYILCSRLSVLVCRKCGLSFDTTFCFTITEYNRNAL